MLCSGHQKNVFLLDRSGLFLFLLHFSTLYSSHVDEITVKSHNHIHIMEAVERKLRKLTCMHSIKVEKDVGSTILMGMHPKAKDTQVQHKLLLHH